VVFVVTVGIASKLTPRDGGALDMVQNSGVMLVVSKITVLSVGSGGMVAVDLNGNDDWELHDAVSLLLSAQIGAIFAGINILMHFCCIFVQALSNLFTAL